MPWRRKKGVKEGSTAKHVLWWRGGEGRGGAAEKGGRIARRMLVAVAAMSKELESDTERKEGEREKKELFRKRAEKREKQAVSECGAIE